MQLTCPGWPSLLQLLTAVAPHDGPPLSINLPCRRAQCYQCQRDRTPGARLVAGPSDLPPSCILRVAGLLPATDEEALRFAFVPHAPGEEEGPEDVLGQACCGTACFSSCCNASACC